MPEKFVLIFQKDRFYPVSDFEITDLPAIQKKSYTGMAVWD